MMILLCVATVLTCQGRHKARAGCAAVVAVTQLPKQAVTPGEQPAITADRSSVVRPAGHLRHPVVDTQQRGGRSNGG